MKPFRKWRKLRRFPELFLADMRSPFLKALMRPFVSLIVRSKNRRELSPPSKATPQLSPRVARDSAGVTRAEASVDHIAHLFLDRAVAPESSGVVSLPWRVRRPNLYLPEMLGFKRCIAPLESPAQAEEVDVFCTWGVTDNVTHNLARTKALELGRPLLSLEYGFVSSFDIALKGEPQLSLLLSRSGMHYDATQPSDIETRLQSAEFELSDTQRGRAADCIRRIVDNRVTKYNHAPELDIRERLSLSDRPKVLLVDQRYGDQSIARGLASMETFEEMLAIARALDGYDILAKVHPDAISGGMESYLGKLLARDVPQNLTFIDFEVSPFSLFDVVDKVFVATSQLGFEALMAGKEVHCFGVPFYAGWGITVDHVPAPRRTRRRSLEEVFHVAYLECSRYFVPGLGVTELESLVDYIAALRKYARKGTVFPRVEVLGPTPESNVVVQAPQRSQAVHKKDSSLRVLFVIPSGRFGATGRATQDLAWHMQRQGCSVLVLAEGSCRPEYTGVAWRRIDFEGMRLSPAVREQIIRFQPDIVYENGVRSRAQRAALEALLLTGARFAMQSEDDDIQVYLTRHPAPNVPAVRLLDKPAVTAEDIRRFVVENDWEHTLRVLSDPAFDRWVEPVLRILCYRFAQLHTAIWHPFAERLKREFDADVLVVPPVASMKSIDPTPLDPAQRAEILESSGIDPESFVFFVGGTVYDYSDEYKLFLEAFRRAQESTPSKMTLAFVSGRTRLALSDEARSHLHPRSDIVDLGQPSDQTYLSLMRACDVIGAPGVPDDFNRYRLSSRLVKAMALAKPIFTFRIGFGEMLEDRYNAFLTKTSDPEEWARALVACLDRDLLKKVGENGRKFAERYFDAAPVARNLVARFKELKKQPPPFEKLTALAEQSPPPQEAQAPLNDAKGAEHRA